MHEPPASGRTGQAESLPRRPPALLLDIDGVLAVSWRAIDGAVEALQSVRAAGTQVRLLTNTTSRPRSAVVDALRVAGFEVGSDEVITAPIATANYLRTHFSGTTAALLCSGDVTADLATSGVEFVDLTRSAPTGPVAVVVLGGAGPEFSYDALDQAFNLVLQGASLVAMHRGLFWRTAAGMQLDTGAFLIGLERAAGIEATIIGKPEAAMFEGALDELNVPPDAAVMIGDDIDSDVRGAQAAGLSGVLVRTGKFRPQVLDSPGTVPDLVTDSIVSAVTALGY